MKMKAEVIPDYNSSYTNTSNFENGHITQPELDQQLKNIISLIQVGLIDPKENPIIIGTPRGDDDEKSTKLSFCDKLKIVGILIFLIIVTVVVTLCIIYLFVPFFSKKSKISEFKAASASLMKSDQITNSTVCQDLGVNDNDFNSFFGIIEVSSKLKKDTRYCLGSLKDKNKILTSLNCFSFLGNSTQKNDLTKFKNESTVKIFLNLKGNETLNTVKKMNLHNVTKINLIKYVSNQDMIEIEFNNDNKMGYKYSCVKNTTTIELEKVYIMFVTAKKMNDSFVIRKFTTDKRCPSIDSNGTRTNLLPGSSLFVSTGIKMYKLTGLDDSCFNY